MALTARQHGVLTAVASCTLQTIPTRESDFSEEQATVLQELIRLRLVRRAPNGCVVVSQEGLEAQRTWEVPKPAVTRVRMKRR